MFDSAAVFLKSVFVRNAQMMSILDTIPTNTGQIADKIKTDE